MPHKIITVPNGVDMHGKPVTRRRVIFTCEGESKTEQSHKKAANINNIVAKYRKTRFLNNVNTTATYGDFVGAGDLHEMQNRILQAQSDFMSIPSELRSLFDNDAGKLLDFIHDPKNIAESVEMGLMDKSALELIPAPESPPEAASEPPEGSGSEV